VRAEKEISSYGNRMAAACLDATKADTFREELYNIRNSDSDIQLKLNAYMFTLESVTVATYLLIAYPIMHILYKILNKQNDNVSSVYFTMGVSLLVILFVIIGPFYGWICNLVAS